MLMSAFFGFQAHRFIDLHYLEVTKGVLMPFKLRQFIMKKYSGHRGVPSGLLEALDNDLSAREGKLRGRVQTTHASKGVRVKLEKVQGLAAELATYRGAIAGAAGAVAMGAPGAESSDDAEPAPPASPGPAPGPDGGQATPDECSFDFETCPYDLRGPRHARLQHHREPAVDGWVALPYPPSGWFVGQVRQVDRKTLRSIQAGKPSKKPWPYRVKWDTGGGDADTWHSLAPSEYGAMPPKSWVLLPNYAPIN